jgi:hypothetical protein
MENASPEERDVFAFTDALLDRAADEIAAAEEIVICPEGGFGHQLHGPDAIRRFFAGRKVLFIFLERFGRHNPFIPLLCLQPRMLQIPLVPLHLHPTHVPVLMPAAVEWAFKLARHIQRRLNTAFGKPAVSYDAFLHYLAGFRSLPHYRVSDQFRIANWVPAYYDLFHRTQAPRRRLPEPLREPFAQALARHRPTDEGTGMRIATLYLRQKGGPVSSAIRSGGSGDDYLPAIALLNRAGYTPCIIGDLRFECPDAVFVEAVVGQMIQDRSFETVAAGLAALDPLHMAAGWGIYCRNPRFFLKKLLELYLMSECALFLGEAGGASNLAPFEGIPTLGLNFFPYATALPNTVHLYKTVRNAAGELAPYQALLGGHAWSYEFPALSVRTNSADEIAGATAHFLETLGQHPAGVGRAQIKGLSDELWIGHCNGTISPAFFRIYERGPVMPAMP